MARQKRKPRVSPEKVDKKKDARKAVRELREVIGYHDHRYYVENAPVISDAEYDGLMEKLVALEEKFPDLWSPDSPTQRVGGEPQEELGSLDGLIAKDKFCMSRYARLSLSHSRLRPKPTGSQTNRAANGPAYPPAGITQHGGVYETPVAHTSGSDATPGRPATLGPSVAVHLAVEPGGRTGIRSERER